VVVCLEVAHKGAAARNTSDDAAACRGIDANPWGERACTPWRHNLYGVFGDNQLQLALAVGKHSFSGGRMNGGCGCDLLFGIIIREI